MRTPALISSFSAAFALALVAGACAPDPVEQPTQERYDACVEAYDCAQDCDSPNDELEELGCGPGDVDSVPPQCETTDQCAAQKDRCQQQCEVDFPKNPDGSRPPELTQCLVQCDVDFGNSSTCPEDFEAWLEERDRLLRDFRDCLKPCEGKPNREKCADADIGKCTGVDYARHDPVNRAENCSINGGDDCEWTCDDPTNGYYMEPT